MRLNSRSFRVVAVGVVGAFLVVGTILAQQSGRGSTTSDSNVIAGPREWVPISYQVDISVDGALEASYYRYRASDGSQKQERHDSKDIAITNRRLSKFYHFIGGEWQEYPMRPQGPLGRGEMMLERSRVTPVLSSDPRISTLRTLSPPVTCYELPKRQDRGAIVCPELNMLEVWRMEQLHMADGSLPVRTMEQRISWIAYGEPQTEFAPPEGVKISVHAEPAGPGILPKSELPASPLGHNH